MIYLSLNKNKMKLIFNNQILLYIPSKIIKFGSNNAIFKLKYPVTYDDKKILYDLDHLNEIKISLNFKDDNEIKNFNIINDYIYRYHLIKDNHNNNYHINKHKISSVTQFSKSLVSCWFLNNL